MSEIKNSGQSCPCKLIVDGWLGRGKKEGVESEKKEKVESELNGSEIRVGEDFLE